VAGAAEVYRRLAPAVLGRRRPPPSDPVLRAALLALTVEQREVVGLRFVADLSLEDVAAVTGRTVGAVKSLQGRALENLRKAVSQPA